MRYFYRIVNDIDTSHTPLAPRLDYRVMTQTLIDRIRIRLEETGQTARAVSLKAGLSESAIRNILTGKSASPRGDTFKRIAQVLDTTPEWLLLGDQSHDDVHVYTTIDETTNTASTDIEDRPTIGSATGVRGIPTSAIPQIDVVGGMGGGGLAITNPGVPGKHGMTFAAEYIRSYWQLPEEIMSALGMKAHDIAIIPVQGDSMSDTLVEGDFVFVDTRHRVPSPDGIYAIADGFGSIIVKRLEAEVDPDPEFTKVHIISDNPRHQTKTRLLSEIHIIGRVVRRFGIV